MTLSDTLSETRFFTRVANRFWGLSSASLAGVWGEPRSDNRKVG